MPSSATHTTTAYSAFAHSLSLLRFQLRLYNYLEGGDKNPATVYIPPSLDATSQRQLASSHLKRPVVSIGRRGLSLDLGGGNCKWQAPEYAVPEYIGEIVYG